MLAADAINRVLERESWARERLAAHAGRTLQIDVGPVSRTFAIAADGRFSESAAAPDLTLTISPLRLPALLAQPERWNQLVAAKGDAALNAALAELALTLPWFVEELCARAFGRVAGQQVARSSFQQRWLYLRANIDAPWTAGMKPASRGRIDRAGDFTGQNNSVCLLLRVWYRNRGQKGNSIWM